MLYDIGCDVLVGDPVFLAGEEVELYRQTFRCGLELAHEDAEIGIDLGEGTEIMLGGGAEETEVHSVAVQNRMEFTSILRERATRRPSLSRIPRQFWNESLTRA